MAGINVSIGVTDNATPALRKMAAAVENLENVLNSVDSRFRNAFDTQSIRAVQKEVAAVAELTEQQHHKMDKIYADIASKEHEIVKIQDKLNELKDHESVSQSRILDLLARQRVAETSRNLMTSQNVERQAKLNALQEELLAISLSGVYTEEEIEAVERRRNILEDEIEHTKSKINQADRISLNLGNQINKLKESGSQVENEIIGLGLKENKLVAEKAVLLDNIERILDKCNSDQEKLAKTQADSVISARNQLQQALAARGKELQATLQASVSAINAKNREANAFNAATERMRIAATKAIDSYLEDIKRRQAASDKAYEKQLQQEEELKQKERQRLNVERAIAAIEALHAREVDKVTKEYNESLALVSKLESTIDRSNKAERAQLAAVKQTCTAREKIMNLTTRLVGVKSKLVALETEGKNKTLEAKNARRQEASILRQIEKHNQKIKNLEVQTLPAINANTAAQKRHNDAIKQGTSNANMLWSKIKSIGGAYLGLQGTGSLINTADSLAANDARLQLMVKEGESVSQLSDEIYAAAMRSRVGYLEMADSVAKVGIQAGNLFSNSGEMVRFMETFNKMGVISKATTQQTNAAMTQLIQALSFGQLRGDELKSILENMPMVAHTLADELTRMGDTFTKTLPEGLRHIANDGRITADEIRELGYEGAISAETVVNAMLNGSKKIDDMASNMTWTWGQVWTVFKNSALRAFTPILNGISKIIQTERFQRFATFIDHVMARVSAVCIKLWDLAGPIFAKIFDWVAKIGGFISDNWSYIAPIIFGIVAALAIFKAVSMASAIWTGIVTAAQWLWNAALTACPLTWIIIGIIAIIAVIYLVVAAINDAENKTKSATGYIFGAVAWLAATIWNILVGLWNAIVGILDVVSNTFISVIEFIVNSFGLGFDNIWQWGANLFGKLIDLLLDFAKVATPILDAVFGINLTGHVERWQNEVRSWGSGNENYVRLNRDYFSNNLRASRVNATDWYNSGYNTGAGIEEKVTGFFSGGKLGEIQSSLDDPANAAGDFTKALRNMFNPQGDAATRNALNGISGNTDDIAKNTGATAENTGNSDEYFKYLRQMADRNSMNRNQLMNFKVDMSNVNHIRSGLDADEIMRRLARELYHEIVGKLDGAEAY